MTLKSEILAMLTAELASVVGPENRLILEGLAAYTERKILKDMQGLDTTTERLGIDASLSNLKSFGVERGGSVLARVGAVVMDAIREKVFDFLDQVEFEPDEAPAS